MTTPLTDFERFGARFASEWPWPDPPTSAQCRAAFQREFDRYWTAVEFEFDPADVELFTAFQRGMEHWRGIQQQRWLTVTEAAALSGYSVARIRRAAQEGAIAARLVGKTWQLDAAAFAAWWNNPARRWGGGGENA